MHGWHGTVAGEHVGTGCFFFFQRLFNMPAKGAQRRVVSAATAERRLAAIVNVAATLRNQLAAEAAVQDIADFWRHLADGTSACTAILYLCCRLRGTRACYQPEEVHRLLVSGSDRPQVLHCLRDAYAMFRLVYRIMRPRASQGGATYPSESADLDMG